MNPVVERVPARYGYRQSWEPISKACRNNWSSGNGALALVVGAAGLYSKDRLILK